MLTRRTKSFTMFRLLGIVVFFVLIGCLALKSTSLSEYCRRCGLERQQTGRSVLGYQVNQKNVERQTEFSQLYLAFVAPQCAHEWEGWSSTEGTFFSSLVACGYYPSVLLHPEILFPLRTLRDKARVKTILLARGNKSEFWVGEDKNAQQAIASLKMVNTRQKENEWWHKNHHLFVKK